MMGHGQGDSIGKGHKFTGVSVDCVWKSSILMATYMRQRMPGLDTKP